MVAQTPTTLAIIYSHQSALKCVDSCCILIHCKRKIFKVSNKKYSRTVPILSSLHSILVCTNTQYLLKMSSLLILTTQKILKVSTLSIFWVVSIFCYSLWVFYVYNVPLRLNDTRLDHITTERLVRDLSHGAIFIDLEWPLKVMYCC